MLKFAELLIGVLILKKVCTGSLNIASPRNTDLVEVPVIFFPADNIALAPPNVQYYKIYQCLGCVGAASNIEAQVSFILPNNVKWDINGGYLLAELSTSPTQWDSQHVFATNYIWNSGFNPVVYSNITWQYSDTTLNESWFYLRITAKNQNTVCSFEISFVDQTVPLISGSYDSGAFKAPSVPNPNWFNIYQFARAITTQKVANNDILLLQVNFCKQDMDNNNYDLYYSVVADPMYPKSAFNVFICSANLGTTCNLNTACVSNYDGASVGFISISSTNSACDLSNGILFGVYGVGGNLDSVNYYDAAITMSN